MKRFVVLCLLSAVALSQGCSRGPDRLEQLVPPDAAFVAGVARLDEVVRAIDGLSGKLAAGMTAVFWQQFRRRLDTRLGFDPASPLQWRQRGIEPSGGAILAVSEGSNTALVLELADRKKFESALSKMLQRLGAGSKRVQNTGGVELVVYSADLGRKRQDKVFCTFRGKFALCTGRESDVGWLLKCAEVNPERSLAHEAWYSARRRHTDKGSELFYVANPARKPAGNKSKVLKNVEAASLRLDETGIFLDAVVSSAGLPDVLARGGAKKGPALEKYLPPDTLVMAAASFEPEKLAKNLSAGGGRKDALEALGAVVRLKAGRDFIASLGGDVAVGLGVAGAEGLGRLVGGDARDPALLEHAAWLIGWVDIENPAVVKRLFDEASSAGSEMAFRRRTKEMEGKAFQIYTLTSPLGRKLHFLLAGKVLGFCAGAGCTDMAMAALLGKGGNVTTRMSSASRKLLDARPAVAIVARLDELGNEIDKIDPRSFEKGGYGIKLAASLLAGLLGGLRDVAVSVDATDGPDVLVRARLWLN